MSSVFLSHSHKDKPFARKLCERLKAHGIRTWLDEAEMQIGDSLISKIESAIRESAYLGVVLSPNSASSEWVRREVNIALTEEIHGRRVKVLPLLYRKCDIPGFLADKLYADFTEDFEEGFGKLLARLTSDLLGEKHKQKRAYEILQAGFQDWVAFGRQSHRLLDRDTLALVLEHIAQPKLSLELLEYLLCSISYSPVDEELDFRKLQMWLNEIGPVGVAELFNRLLRYPDPRVRLGAVTLAQRLGETNAIDSVLASIKGESDRDVRRASLRSMSGLGKRLPSDLAHFLLDTDKDWMVQSYALKNLGEYRPCLLVSDGTGFATGLGAMAQNAGFTLVTLSDPLLFWEIQEADGEAFKTYELLILVRGEHFSQSTNESFYSKLRRFVSEGGSLFATSWTSWETKYHHEFAGILPFIHVRDTYMEDIMVTCQSTGGELAKRLFPNRISYRTSLELLQNREGSVVLAETDAGIPIFGYRCFGSGLCYYLNTCQHSCLGSMPSPLQTSSELRDSLQRVFEWIYSTHDIS